jgi:EAL domain-containing protein (putative c-di-GMP-specific phosphodiesterase class I)
MEDATDVAPGRAAVGMDELLHRADVAMYSAKRSGTHGWKLYAEDAMDAGYETRELAEELRRAVTAGELRLHYQPIVTLATGELVAVEALLRWQHPSRGLLAPAAFIPLAEQHGLIDEVGAWVLEHACHQVRAWQQRVPAARSLQLGVNISAVQLAGDTLSADVLDTLHRTGLDPRHLVLEITENALLDDQSAIPHLNTLRRHGVRVALDDYGSGYPTLRHLSSLPVDVLKIDRCFVADLNGDAGGSAVRCRPSS